VARSREAGNLQVVIRKKDFGGLVVGVVEAVRDRLEKERAVAVVIHKDKPDAFKVVVVDLLKAVLVRADAGHDGHVAVVIEAPHARRDESNLLSRLVVAARDESLVDGLRGLCVERQRQQLRDGLDGSRVRRNALVRVNLLDDVVRDVGHSDAHDGLDLVHRHRLEIRGKRRRHHF
jgi:hypothetical protein